MAKAKKSNRGGRREGSGRKKSIPNLVGQSFGIRADQLRWLMQLTEEKGYKGLSAMMRELLDRARKMNWVTDVIGDDDGE